MPWSHEPNRGLPALRHRAGQGGRGDRGDRRARALHPAPPRQRPEPGALNGHWPQRSPSSGCRAVSAAVSAAELLAAGHQPGEVGGVDVVPGQAARHLTVRQQQEPVADQVGVARGVGHLQHGQSLAAGGDDRLQHQRLLGDGERRRRLVDDQRPRAEVQGAGDGQALPLAGAQRAGRCVRVQPGDADARQRGDRRVPGAVEVDASEQAEPAGRLGAEEEVPPHRQQRGDGEVLPHGRDAGGAGLAGRAEAHRLAADQQRALGVPGQPRQKRHQRRLARAVLAEHAGDLAGGEDGADAGERGDRAEPHGHPAQFEHRQRSGAHDRGAAFSRRRTTPLVSSAISSRTPSSAWNHSGSHPAITMPLRATA